MKKSAFKHYSLTQSQRHQLEVKRFGGVDYSTQKFLVADGHAIDMKNFVYRDGIVQKRHGIEEILAIPDVLYVPADFDVPTQASVSEVHSNYDQKTINGIWKFEAEDGREHVVAHIGKLMYEIKNIGNEHITANLITTGVSFADGEQHYLAYEFEDYKSSAFVGGKKLWFLGGNKYMCLRFLTGQEGSEISFFAVDNSDSTPVPTTTISITYKNSIVNKRMSYDSVNLLTKWRKNKLISGTSKSEEEKTKTAFFEYTLDAPLKTKTKGDMADILVIIEEQGKVE